MESNGQGRGAWSNLVEMWGKANLNFCGSLKVAILAGSELQYFVVRDERIFATVTTMVNIISRCCI